MAHVLIKRNGQFVKASFFSGACVLRKKIALDGNSNLQPSAADAIC
jgi:hypothetical protein